MSQNDENLSDIARALAMLKPEQIAKIMGSIRVNNRAYKIDYSARIRKFNINAAYFSSATYPHNHDSFEEYRDHDEEIRQQVLSEYGCT